MRNRLYTFLVFILMKAPKPKANKKESATVDQPKVFAPANWPRTAITQLSPFVMNRASANFLCNADSLTLLANHVNIPRPMSATPQN